MSGGRTYWWMCDAAWYDRERVADLVLEHGPTGAAVLHWLSCHAKTLNDGGQVITGYSAIAKGIGGTLDAVRNAVRYAAEIGALDDFEEDGKRFTAAVSGWTADQTRATGAARVAKHRSTDVTVGNGLQRSGNALKLGEREKEKEVEGSNGVLSSSRAVTQATMREESPDVISLCELLADEMRRNDAKAKTPHDTAGWRSPMRKIIDLDGRTPDEVRAVIVWCQRDEFWRANILSPAKLRRQFPGLLARMGSQPRPSFRVVRDEQLEARELAAFEARIARRDAVVA